jgi:hypothetical protein
VFSRHCPGTPCVVSAGNYGQPGSYQLAGWIVPRNALVSTKEVRPGCRLGRSRELSRNAFAETRTQSASLETSFPGIALNEAEHTIIPEHSLPFAPSADLAKQRRESALRFRDSVHLAGELRGRTLRKAGENGQKDMSLRSVRAQASASFAVHPGVNATFSNSFRFNWQWRPARLELAAPCLEGVTET